MKGCKGFTLIEVIAALSILTIITASSLPIMITIYNERITVKESYHALEVLHSYLQGWIYDGSEPVQNSLIEKNGTNYEIHMSSQYSGRQVYTCVYWTGTNGRYYERCEYAKR